MNDKGRVFVVDDDDAVRDSLTFLLRSSGYGVQAFSAALDALAGISATSRGCVVTDVRMPGMSGVDLLRNLRARANPLQVVIITGHGDVPMAVEAMKAGAVDFLEKPFSNDALLAAIDRALAPVDQGADDQTAERLAHLSQRERQVLVRLVKGQLNKTVAFELGISMRTVEVYRANIMSKMRAESFAELVRMAIRAGVETD